jgi:steroid 5-alpha reductase family enzyme
MKPNDRRRGFIACGVAYAVALGSALASGTALRGQASPLVVAGVADVVATIVVFGFSRAFDNSSVYDPYWSVAPPFLLAFFAWTADGPNTARLIAAVVVVGLWAVRLTYNWARRWDGLAHEDFRYVDHRAKHGRLYWLVSFFGIHLFPTVLVFLGCLPLYYAATSPTPFGVLDALGTGVALVAIGIESHADATLRAFVTARPDPTAVLREGLWRTSRHPNYFGEILFWWGLLGLSLGTGFAAAWTAVGAVAITALFVFVSVPLMDARMLTRRPSYAEHMKTTNAIVPRGW